MITRRVTQTLATGLVSRSIPVVARVRVRQFSIIQSKVADTKIDIHREIGRDAESPDALALNYIPDSERPASPFTIPPRKDGADRKKGRRAGRKSGMQLEILKLYREILRASKEKDGPDSTETFDAARAEFRRQVGCAFIMHSAFYDDLMNVVLYLQSDNTGRSNFQLIEHQVRKGKKYLKMLNMDGVDGFSLANIR